MNIDPLDQAFELYGAGRLDAAAQVCRSVLASDPANTDANHLLGIVYFRHGDNMAAREKAWDTFRANPDWARVRNKPGWTDPEAVSNIHAAFLRPTAYSQIR